ncbi:MAG TPA: DoxX family protein [Casimicrobiaceae bacterium]
MSRLLDRLQPLLLLGFRLYVAQVFFMSGLTKTRDWSSTVALFTDEYHVPLLAPPVAAALGAATELSMPVFLALGLGSRLAAGVLFVFNIIAVLSYYETLTQTGGVKDHVLWGTMLLVLTIFGPGKIALDTLLERRFGR